MSCFRLAALNQFAPIPLGFAAGLICYGRRFVEDSQLAQQQELARLTAVDSKQPNQTLEMKQTSQAVK